MTRWFLAALLVIAAGPLAWLGGLRHRVGLTLDPASPQPGQTVRILISGVPFQPQGRWGNSDLPFFKVGLWSWRALAPVQGDAEGSIELRVWVPAVRALEWKLPAQVAAKAFPSQTIRLQSSKAALFEDPGVGDAQKRIRQELESLSPVQFWEGTFRRPLPGPVTGLFGNRRVMSGGRRYYHKGLDLSSPAGTPVRAASSGRVLLAGTFPLQGNLVLLDHGQGVVTGYQHMERILVSEGRTVRPGEPVGTVGATGVTTGPHLHWTVYVRGVAVDPEDWLERAF